MFKKILNPELLSSSVYTQRWASLVRANTDIPTITSWDPTLNRNKRILVPIDVQAYVANESTEEELVAVTGGPDDPEPFAQGSKAQTGVHLHWAMPDSLLRGKESDEGGELAMPDLPNRWVVIRALFPVGLARPMLRGWVIDAQLGSVSPLDGFNGDMQQSSLPEFDRLDGAVGGSLLWTASYHASKGRFGFHDSLDDLDDLRNIANQGFTNDVATYIVAGWQSDLKKDPLTARDSSELFDLLSELNWYLDPESDELNVESDTPVSSRLQASGVFARPPEAPAAQIVARGRAERFTFADVAPVVGLPIDDPAKIIMAQRPPRFSSLLHGMVTGVPIDDDALAYDERPESDSLSVAIGQDTDDIVAALGASTLSSSTSNRRGTEMLAGAISSDLLDRLGSPEGMRDIAEREHADTFWSFPGKPLAAAKPDQLRMEDSAPTNPTNVGRRGRSALRNTAADINPLPQWRDRVKFARYGAAPKVVSPQLEPEQISRILNASERRSVIRPAPRLFRPQAPIVAVRGAKPSLRHHHDGLHDEDNRLRCRYPNEAVNSIKGVVEAAELVPSLGSGALPVEVLTVVREAMVLNPYCSRWLATAAAQGEDTNLPIVESRINAEMLRLFSPDGRYDGTGAYTLSTAPLSTRGRTPRAVAGDAWNTVSANQQIIGRQIAAEVSRISYLIGTSPSPLGVTAWRQPWVPLWLEWRVELMGSDTLDDWELGDLDLVRKRTTATNPKAFEFVGRGPVGRGLTTALHAGIERWIEAEQQRDATQAILNNQQKVELERLSDFLEPLDLASASLDGIREQLLGIRYIGNLTSEADEDDTPVASESPTPMFGGTIRLAELRLVDAFGRTLNVPVKNVLTTSTLEVEGSPASIRIPPRLQHGARCLMRFVDPAYRGDPCFAPEAFVNQLEPELAVNPVSGFLLPDHIDEALEAFDVNGKPIGQLSHHELSGAVRWEPAPGLAVAPGTGPLAKPNDQGKDRPVREIAVGMVRADAKERALTNTSDDSSLTAMLRAIDTTLWSIDTYGTIGSSAIAGLVGRPIAVVKATLKLDMPDDLDEVVVSAAGGKSERSARFDALKEQRFPVRLGDLQRSDDSLLGFYVGDDFDHFHIVDKVIAANARDTGRHRGQLGLLGQVSLPGIRPLEHSFLTEEDTLYVRPGQVINLTLLMLPAGKVHVTTGILPQKALSLADAWVSKGLGRVIPSVRVGPVLVDPEEIRLPKVNLLGDKQQFTRRTGPLTWRDDPIISATQSAVLPRTPHEIQEGWIRIVDEDE